MSRPASSRKPRVLLVDDEPMLLRSVSRYLELLGWDVVRCTDGGQGRDAARAGAFDAIVADFDLPTLPGTDLLDSLGDLRPPPRLVITSGHTDLLARWRRAGAHEVAVLHKPYAMEDLIRLLGSEARPRGTAPACGA